MFLCTSLYFTHTYKRSHVMDEDDTFTSKCRGIIKIINKLYVSSTSNVVKHTHRTPHTQRESERETDVRHSPMYTMCIVQLHLQACDRVKFMLTLIAQLNCCNIASRYNSSGAPRKCTPFVCSCVCKCNRKWHLSVVIIVMWYNRYIICNRQCIKLIWLINDFNMVRVCALCVCVYAVSLNLLHSIQYKRNITIFHQFQFQFQKQMQSRRRH